MILGFAAEKTANSKRNTRSVKYTLSLAICFQLKLERFEIISAFPLFLDVVLDRRCSWRAGCASFV